MQDYIQMIITAVVSIMGTSAGFWVFLQARMSARDARTRLLMGLAHEKIVTIGMELLDRGYVTKDEYEDLSTYFYKPYLELGGNGTAERIMHAIERLPLASKSRLAEVVDKTDIRRTDRNAEEGPPSGTHRY